MFLEVAYRSSFCLEELRKTAKNFRVAVLQTEIATQDLVAARQV
jgi:hypothetical protein